MKNVAPPEEMARRKKTARAFSDMVERKGGIPGAMSEKRFKSGDAVRLKSGLGPTMTVDSIFNTDSQSVVWFLDGICHRNEFKTETLVSVDDNVSARDGTYLDWLDQGNNVDVLSSSLKYGPKPIREAIKTLMSDEFFKKKPF